MAQLFDGIQIPAFRARSIWQIASGVIVACIAASAHAQIGRPTEKPKPVEQTPTYTVKARAGEVRATWLRLGEGDDLANPGKTAETMKRLRDLGFNTVYVSVWQDGYPMFPSAVFAKAGGGPGSSPDLGARNLLSETLIEAHRNGLIYIAAFEGGLAATRRDREGPLKKKDAWILRDAKGAAMGPQICSWMSPANPEVRTFLVDLVGEVVENYDIDGVQIDERMCWPDPSLGFDQATKDAFAKENGGKTPPSDPKEPAWARWKTAQGTRLVREVAASVKQKRPGLIMSFAAPTPKMAMEDWMCDWPAMMRQGAFDEVVVKAFRPDVAAFTAAWTETAAAAGGRRPEVVVGLRASGNGPDLSWPDLKKEIDTVREAKAGGFAVAPSRSVLFTLSAAFNEHLSVAKNGRVRHPLRALEWRPGVLKPERMSSRGQLLVVKGMASGYYRVIAGGKEPGVWVESRLKIAEAAATMTPEQAAAMGGGGTLEFLVDRRTENMAPIPDPSAPPPEPLSETRPTRPAKPGEAKPGEAKPGETKPGEKKPGGGG